MSGLRKAKKYDWKDSNMALFGSDTDKAVKKESAETEKAWHGCGQAPGLRIWRINKFQVEAWPEEDYGKFFDGDSYIVLNTYTQGDSDELLYDVHFWIGKFSTQDEYGTAAYKTVELDALLDDKDVQHREDEYGTAAYKTVELDTLLDDKPVQHREVQGHESKLFKSYFKAMSTMKGGADTGFKRVPVESYEPRLLRFQKNGRKITMTEHGKKKSLLQPGDVFILDNGLELIQWNGAECNQMEKYEAAQFLNQLKGERVSKGPVQTRIYEQNELSEQHRFYNYFTDDDDDDDDNDDDQEVELGECGVNLVKVCDEDGSVGMEEIQERQLTPDAVYLVQCKEALYVWVGSGASVEERRNGLSYAHQFLSNTTCPWLPVSVVAQDQEPNYFKNDVQLPVCA